jgi:hypothetical protein
MNAIPADYEQEVTTFSLSVEKFGILFDPSSMLWETTR